MNSLEEMRLFLAVADTGSFSAAGRHFNLSTSSVSRKMAALEASLGLALFIKGSRSLRLTEAGQFYLSKALEIIETMERAQSEVRAFQSQPKGHLRISSVPEICEAFIAPMLKSFNEQHPQITIELHLEARKIDFARENIDMAIRVGDLGSADLIARKLTTNDMALVASPTYLERKGTPKKPNQIQEHQIISYWATFPFQEWAFTQSGKHQLVSFNANYTATTGRAMIDLALADLGITLLPLWFTNRFLRRGKLVQIMPSYSITYPQFKDSSVYAVYPYAEAIPPKTRLFIDACTAFFNAYNQSMNLEEN
jgi:DNA-binding transcriptional LysR family regulator